jgi:hypothetical protein
LYFYHIAPLILFPISNGILIFGLVNFSHVAIFKNNYTIIDIAKPTHPILQPKPSQQEKSMKRKNYDDN